MFVDRSPEYENPFSPSIYLAGSIDLGTNHYFLKVYILFLNIFVFGEFGV
jgi:hypothetical protein